jgi:uroporphyrinogen decarboxylase
MDEWGVKWHRPVSSHYYDMVERTLSGVDFEGLNRFPWPDPDAPGRTDGLAEAASTLFHETDFALFSSGAGVFELTWQSYGMEALFAAIGDDPRFLNKLLDKTTELLAGLYGRFLDAVGPYLDCLELYSDLGTQRGPLFSPSFYRQVLMPRDKELLDFLRGKTSAKMCLHSCGSTYAFLPDVIAAGFEVLNPVQTTAADMDAVRLKREFGKDLVFWGAIDTQQVLPFGTPDDIRREVAQKVRDLGPCGGYILAACHNIQAQTPPENVLAMFEAACELGQQS